MKVTRRFRSRLCRSHRAGQPPASSRWGTSCRVFLALAWTGALSAWALGPAVNTLTPGPVTNNAAVSTLTLEFTEALDPARAGSAAAFEVLNLGANRAVGGGDDATVTVTPAYTEGALLVALSTPAPLAEGRYRITAKSDSTNGLRNLSAEYLDQNQDGTPDNYVGYLDVDLTPPAVSTVVAGTCLRFEDGSDMITLPAAALHGRAAYTVEVWFQTTKTAGQALLGAMQSNGVMAFQFWLSGGTLWVETAAGSPSVALPDVYDGRWHHLAAAYSDAADRLEVVYDGTVTASFAYTGAAPSVAEGAFVVGQEQDAPGGGFDPGQAFQGRMAELRIWGVARTGAEVAASMFQQAAGGEAGLVACWHLDDASDTIPDVTGNGFGAALGDWQGGDLPPWAPAPTLLLQRRTLYVTYADVGGMDAATVANPANYAVLRSGGDGGFGEANEVDLTAGLQTVTYIPGTTAAVLRFGAPFTEDLCQLTITGTATVRDAAGNPLLGGTDYVSPGIPVAVGLPTVVARVAPEDDTGASDTDALTMRARPGLLVTVDRKGTLDVDFNRDGTYEFSGDAPSAGAYTVEPAADLPEGATTPLVRFTSWLGAERRLGVPLVVDTVPPQVSGVAVGTALNFDGTDDYVVTPARTWGFTTSATLAAWVKTTDSTGTVISLAHGDVNNELLLLVSDGKAQVIQHKQPGNYWYRSGTSIVNHGRWVHLTGVVDGTGTAGLRLFVNGVEEPLGVAGQAGGPSAVSDATPRWVALGGRLRNGYRSELLAGQIDEVQVWGRALAPAEVAALVGAAPTGGEAGLAGYWRLDEGAGTSAADTVGGGAGVLGDGNAAYRPTWTASAAPFPRRSLRIAYDDLNAMDEASVLDVANYALTGSGGDGVFGDGDDIDLTASLVDLSYDPATRMATLRCDPPLVGEIYQLTIAGTTTVRDGAGNPLLGGTDVHSDPLPTPARPTAVSISLDPASDTGSSNSDLLTGDATPTLSVTVSDRGTLAVHLDGELVPGWGQAVATAGTYGLTAPSPLAPGYHQLIVVFTPWVGDAASVRFDLVVDTGGPRVTAVDPYTPSPCYARTVHFDRPVRTADFLPDQVVIADALGTPIGAASTVTPLFPGLTRNPATGTWYLPVYRPDGCTWFEAEAEARRLGGSLVAIADGAEMTFVRNLVADLRYSRHLPGGDSIGPWIGLRRDAETPGPYYHWFWPDGTPMGYTYWGSGQPYGAGGGQYVVHLGGDYHYWYDDLPTTAAPGFIVEFPTIPLYASSWRIDFDALPGAAEYTLAFGPDLVDAAGNPMDQDGDGTPGEAEEDRFTDTFAVQAPAPGLQVVSALPTGADPAAVFRHIELVFNRPVDAGSVGVGDATLTPAGGGVAIAASAVSQVDDLRWRFDFGQAATGQAYDFAVGPQIAAAAVPMDQDGDGVPGEAAEDVYHARLQNANLTLSDGDTSLDNAHLVFWGGTHTVAGSHPFASVALLNGAVLTHPPCTADLVHRLDLSVTGTVFVDPASAIDVTGKGYLPGRTGANAVQDPTQQAGGGSHGGLGRPGTTVGAIPAAYDDFADPREPGGGGSVAGGGLVRLQAGTLVLEGTLRADGTSAYSSGSAGGGAGGGVRLDVGTLAGAGQVTADGGSGDGGYYGYYGGSGGGGRVAVYYGTLAGFDPESQVRALSRHYPIGPGSVGTVYLSPSDGADQLRLDSQGTSVGQYTPLLPSVEGDVAVGALVIVGPGVVAQTGPGVGIVADDLSVLDGASLTHAACTADVSCSLDMAVTGTLRVDAASSIDVTGRGYLPGRSVGNQPPASEQKSFGGSHGGLGRGGSWGGTMPAPYDDLEDPALPGGGGSNTAGGGVVRIHAGAIILDGAVRANGVSGWHGISGGAGGSVRLETGTLSGTGSVSADGGAASMGDYASTGGSGGGGRVALYYGSLDGFDVTSRVTAHSPASPAGPGSVGTVYLQPAGGTPQVRLDSHGGPVGLWTPLLPGGDGVVRLGELVVRGAGVVAAAWHGEPIVAATVAVLEGASLTHPVPTAAETYGLELTVAGLLHVDAASSIDVSTRGCPGTTTLGVRTVGAAKSGAGGSYGGAGFGNSSNSLYGQPENPRYPGSGGAPYLSSAGAGGGLVRVHAAEAVIDGAIRANGGNGAYYWAMPGGSGGGILINVGDWSGTGVVEAKGGNGNWGDYGSNGGSGGGGRIAVHVGGTQGVDVPSLSAAGGTGGSGRGGDGTVVLNTAPSFFWADPRPGVFGEGALLRWELLAAPADTTVALHAAPAGGAEQLLAEGLPPVGSYEWDTAALPSGAYRVRAVYGNGGRAVTGEASCNVLLRHGATLHGGRIATNETWPAGVLHLVTDDVTIPSGVTLTLAAGALVKVAEGRSLRVLPGGALVSEGPANTPAVLTSLRDDTRGGDDNADGSATNPAPGDWGGIVVEAGTALPGADSLILLYGTREHAGELAASTTWEAENLHRVRDDVSVPAGRTLTIAAGAVVRFDRTRALVVSGTLGAAGVVGAPILLTSLYDTESDAPAALAGPYASHTPTAGDWLGVYVQPGGTGVFDRVHLRYGGGRQTGYDRTAMLRARRSAVTVRNCRIEESQYDGVTADWSDDNTRFEMTNCIVSGCDVGFHGADNSYGVCQVLGTTFYGNRLGVGLEWGAATPRIIRNSIIAQSTETGISVWGGANVFEWNNVWGSGTTNYSGGLADQTGKNGNISADPRFCDPDHGDLGLSSTSPCIDAGNGTYAAEQDLAGLPRNDYPRVADTGVPMPGTAVVPDLGALEYSQHVNTNIDLAVTAVTGPTVAVAGDEVTITWQVANRGTERASGWRRDRIGLSTAMGARGQSVLVCGDVAFTATIDPGQTVTFAANVRVPGGTPGVWNWLVTANVYDDVAEGANRANNTGLSATALTLSLPMLVLNAPTALSGTLSGVGSAAWYALAIPAGQDALLRVDAGVPDARLRLYAGIGFLPTVYDYDWMSPSSAADPRLALPAGGGAQTVYVLVVAENLPSGPTTFTASAADLVFALDACDRRSGGNAGNTTVRLTGAGFSSAMSVALRNGARNTIPAASVSVLNSGEAFAVFGLDGVATGGYDVVAETGGAEAVLGNAFTVTEGTGWDFACRVTAPPLVRPGRPFPVLIEFENTGDADCPPIMVSVSNDGGFPVWRSRRLEASVLPVAAVAPSGPTPGYLRPGERYTVAAWSASNNVLCNYTISWRSAFCTEPVDWDAVEAALCPCNHPHWDEVWPALQAAVGGTDGDYIRAAGAAVAEARAYGVVLLENTDIFQWLLDRQTYYLESATVTGSVRRQGTLEPVGRLNMTLVPRDGSEAYAGVTWHDGRFAFWDLPAGVYEVTLEGVYGGEGLSLEVPTDGILRDVILELPAGGALAGSVTDAGDGTPVAEAEVEVLDPFSGMGAQVLTGADGRYHVSGLPPNTVIIRVMPQDHAPAEAVVTGITAGATLAWSVAVPPGAAICGTVSAPGGAAVVGATVLATPADGSLGRSTRSAADGSYEIRGLAGGTYRLDVMADGYGAGGLDGVVVAAGASASADLVLTVPGALSGRVADAATGGPIAGAEIAVSGTASGEPLLTDAAGLFTIGGLPAGEVALMVSAAGYLPLTQVVTVGGKPTLEFALDRPWVVEGCVRDGAAPAAGLEVSLQHTTGASVATTTAADGKYSFTGLRGGDWRLIVSGPLGEMLVNEVLSLVPAEKSVWKEYDVGRGLVSGRVLDASGTPLAGADVRLARDGAVVAETTSDAAGAFAFQAVSAGTYDVSVANRAFGFARRSGVVVVSGATTDLGDWSPAGVALHVLVTDGAAPLPGAAVELVWLSGVGGESVLGQATAAGTIVFEGLAAGTYRLGTTALGYAYQNQGLAVAGDDLQTTVALGPEGVLAGTVSTAEGSPSPFAMLWVTDLVDHVTSVILADGNAEYSLGGLPAHPLRVWVTDSANVPVAFEVTPVAGATTTADVVLPAVGARLRGRTVDLLGQVLPGVTVQVRTADDAVLKSTISGMDGTYELGPLPTGDFVLHCSLPGVAAVTVPVTVAGDADLDDVAIGGSKHWVDRGTARTKGIWDWLHGQQPPKRYINDTPTWRALHQAIWSAYVASGRNCPDAPAAYDLASRSARSIDTRYDAWCLTYAAMSGMTSAEMNTLAAEIGILTGKISLLVANFTGAMDTMTGPAFLTNISPNAPADLVKAYNDMSFAIDFAVDSLTRLVAYLRTGNMSASDAMFEQALSSIQFMVGTIEMFAKVAVQSGVAGSTATKLAGGAVGKALGVVMTLRDLYNYWKDLKEKEKNILETIKANERAQEMYHDMLQRHMEHLSRLSSAVNCDDDDDPPPPPPPPPPPNPQPPPGGFPDGGNGPSAAVGRVISRDPNAKESLGVGAANWVPGDRAITYIVYFENEDDATAPAQTVTVTDVFDANLDLESFEALQVSFNGTTVDLPAGTRDFLGTGTVASDPYPVRLRVDLNAATRTATWTLQSYDPATGELPTDPLAGFLPPNDATGRGEGFVVFRLAPVAGLLTGTGIRNVARIVFDENEPIMTNQIDPHDPTQGTSPDKEALATLDIEAPASAVAGLDALSPPEIVVSWAGRDDLAGVEGSGAATYTVYVQDNGGPFTPWLTDTPLTTETYSGEAGHTYGFYSTATDAVGWQEPPKAAAEATTVAAYTVQFEAGPNGSVNGSTTQYVAPGGQTSAVEAAADETYHFVAWMRCGQVYSLERSLVVSDVNEDLTLTAEFEINQYSVTFRAGAHGSLPGGVPMVTVTVNHGDQAPAAPAVTASAGWEFTGWSDALPQTITADAETTALYARITHTVTFLPGEHGTLPGGVPMVTVTVNYGDDPASVAPAVTASAGWEFTGWSPALPETITEDVTTTAQYARITHTVTFFPGAHGSLPGGVPMVTVTVNHGSDPASVAPAITPVAGWLFTGWSPALPGAVTADLAATAQYAAAGAVAPDGPFHAEVDATAAAAGAGIWVLTGDYPTTATTLGSYGLALRLTHDSRGRVTGDGTFLPDPVGAPAYGIPLAVRGSVKGSAGAAVVKLTLKGQRVGTPGDAQASARVTITLTAALDVEQKALLGSTLVALSMGADRQSTTPACRIDLPAAVDGTYALDVDLARVGKTLHGTATLTLAARTPYQLLATGRYSNPYSVLRLSGASGDPAAGGIKLGAAILTLEDRSATILDLSGTAFGQSVRWSP